MKAKDLARGALIGALYVLLTLLFAPISSGLAQMRVSEALCVLPCFTFSAVPGLFIGCLIANLLTGAAPYDVLFGSLATLLAAIAAWRMRRAGWNRWLMPLPSVLFNALIVGWLLCYVYAVGVSFPLCALYVGAGQAAACYGLGMPLMSLLEGYGGRLFR